MRRMPPPCSCALGGLLLLASLALRAQKSDQPKRHVADFLEIRLDLDIDAPAGCVSGRATYLFKPLGAQDSIFLHAEDTRISQARLDGLPVSYRRVPGGYWFKARETLSGETLDSLQIRYGAQPRKGMYFLGWNDPQVKPEARQIWTQGQGMDNRHWFPSYDLQTDKVQFELKVRFDSRYRVLSNGECLGQRALKDGRTEWTYAMRKPMSTYLLALVIGRYAQKEVRVHGLPLYFYSYPSDSDKVAATYRKSAALVSFFEKELIPFPWSSYSQVPVRDFLHGGMENTTLTVFPHAYMTDFKGIDLNPYLEVNAHELAHQWFGNLVTAPGARDHWLHEGFASFYSLLARTHLLGEDEGLYQWQQVKSHVFRQEKQNPNPVLSAQSGDKAYDKGAYFLRLLRREMGAKKYRRAIRAYLRKYAYGIANTADFESVIQAYTRKDLKKFFRFWLTEKAHPLVDCQVSRVGRVLRLDFDYRTADTVGLVQRIPLEVYSGNRRLRRKTVRLTGGEQRFAYRIPRNAPDVFVTLDASLQALAEIQPHKDRAMWVAQLRYGPNFIAKGRALAFLAEARDTALPRLIDQSLSNRDFYALWMKAAEVLRAYPVSLSTQRFYSRALEHPNRAVRMAALRGAQAYYRVLLPVLKPLLSSEEPVALRTQVLDILLSLDPLQARAYLKASEALGQGAPLFRIHWLAWQILVKRSQGLDFSAEQAELLTFGTGNYDFSIRFSAYEITGQVRRWNESLLKNLLKDCCKPAVLKINGLIPCPWCVEKPGCRPAARPLSYRLRRKAQKLLEAWCGEPAFKAWLSRHKDIAAVVLEESGCQR